MKPRLPQTILQLTVLQVFKLFLVTALQKAASLAQTRPIWNQNHAEESVSCKRLTSNVAVGKRTGPKHYKI